MGSAGRPLLEEHDAGGDEHQQYRRCGVATQGESTGRNGLIEKITEDGTERASQHEGCPEQQGVRNARPQVRPRDKYQQCAENRRRAQIAETSRVRSPVAECDTRRRGMPSGAPARASCRLHSLPRESASQSQLASCQRSWSRGNRDSSTSKWRPYHFPDGGIFRIRGSLGAELS